MRRDCGGQASEPDLRLGHLEREQSDHVTLQAGPFNARVDHSLPPFERGKEETRRARTSQPKFSELIK
jgi:hypothetical protein